MGQVARVVEEVDPATGEGRVRMETETWRATTDGGPIPVGANVRVLEVRGTRLVVEPEK
jgi:membrane protein implicated in regulation of membrane protease activity